MFKKYIPIIALLSIAAMPSSLMAQEPSCMEVDVLNGGVPPVGYTVTYIDCLTQAQKTTDLPHYQDHSLITVSPGQSITVASKLGFSAPVKIERSGRLFCQMLGSLVSCRFE